MENVENRTVCSVLFLIKDFKNGANSVEYYKHFDVPADFLEFSHDSEWRVFFLAMTKQLLLDLCLGDLDYLIMDAPPGMMTI